MDTIFISDFRLDILVGVYDWETRVPQKVQFDLEIGLPGGKVSASDRLADTIDYAAVVSRIETSLPKPISGCWKSWPSTSPRSSCASSSRHGSRSVSPSSRH